MKLSELITCLEQFAPPSLQESYDNSGLQVGDLHAEVTGVYIALDCTSEVIQEALNHSCNTIITHHPLIFTPLRSLGTGTETEKLVRDLIQKELNLYSFHTNFDTVLNGVNTSLADALNLNLKGVIMPKARLWGKLQVFVPPSHVNTLSEALFKAGAGSIGSYSQCSFKTIGTGTFLPDNSARPFIGKAGTPTQTEEIKLECIYPVFKKQAVLSCLQHHHPYETPAFDLLDLDYESSDYGSGAWGWLNAPLSGTDFLKEVASKLHQPVLSYSGSLNHPIQRVGICGGSGAFLIPKAQQLGLDAFITSDISYHKFFLNTSNFLLVNAGHAETEQFTLKKIADVIQKEFPKFAIHFSEKSTSPVKYFKL